MLVQVLREFGPSGREEFVERTARQGKRFRSAGDRVSIDVVEVQRKAFVVGEMVHRPGKAVKSFTLRSARRCRRLVMLAVVASVPIHACEFGGGGFVMIAPCG